MKDELKKYRYLLVPLIVTTIVLSALAFYCSGVVDLNNNKDIIDVRLEKIVQRLKADDEERTTIKNDILSDCEEKSQMVAMMISQNSDQLSYELSLEEIRVMVNADEISISDSNGYIQYSTSTYTKEDTILDRFVPYADDKTNYARAIIDEYNRVVTVTNRLDDAGAIQLIFSPDSMEQMLKSTDVSMVTSEYPLLRSGFTAIIDVNTYTYLSHTDTMLINTPSQLPKDKFDFDKEKGGFFYSVGGKKCYIRYIYDGNNIIVGVLPSSEIYRLRNSLTWWVLVSGSLLTLTAFLTIRFKNIINV